MAGICSRCGRQGEIEYGADGLAYCSACSFYGLNKQCWRCRMYVPASEVQQYRGQWVCPICIADMRREDQRASEYKPDKYPLRPLTYPETCERCGRDSDILYLWNGRHLCRSCLEAEQESWGVVGRGPGGAGQPISLQPIRVKEEESFLEHLIGEFLAWLGIRKKKKQVVVVPLEAEHHEKMPVDRAKPMAEDHMMQGSDEERMPSSEGLMKKSKRKKKASKKKRTGKDTSFPEYKKEEKPEDKKSKKKSNADDPFSRFKDKKKK